MASEGKAQVSREHDLLMDTLTEIIEAPGPSRAKAHAIIDKILVPAVEEAVSDTKMRAMMLADRGSRN